MYMPKPTWQTHFWQMDARKVYQASCLRVFDSVVAEDFTPGLAMQIRELLRKEFPFYRIVRLYVSSDSMARMFDLSLSDPSVRSGPWVSLMEVSPVEEITATGVIGRALGMEICTDRFEPTMFHYLPDGEVRVVAFDPKSQDFVSLDVCSSFNRAGGPNDPVGDLPVTPGT